jgi:hypothetical protein
MHGILEPNLNWPWASLGQTPFEAEYFPPGFKCLPPILTLNSRRMGAKTVGRPTKPTIGPFKFLVTSRSEFFHLQKNARLNSLTTV